VATAAIGVVSRAMGADTPRVLSLENAPDSSSRAGLWLYTQVNVPTTADGGAIRAAWDADVAQGALAASLDSGQSDLSDVIVGSDVTGLLPSGDTVDLQGSTGSSPASQQFTGSQLTDSEISEQLGNVAKSFGMTVLNEQVYRLPDAAVAVRLSTSSVAAVRRTLPGLLAAVRGTPDKFAGLYVELDLPSGEVIARLASSPRTGTTRTWIRPSAASELGMLHA
jgi:hypothetical protein